ncbi:hypothetical protein LXL04_008542 [Taraxacum kok-saghyz]
METSENRQLRVNTMLHIYYPPGFLRKVAAEVVSTFLLVFVSCGAAAVGANNEQNIGGSFVGGLIVTVMIYSVGHISGAHMNPAITIAFATVKRFPWNQSAWGEGQEFDSWLEQLVGFSLAGDLSSRPSVKREAPYDSPRRSGKLCAEAGGGLSPWRRLELGAPRAWNNGLGDIGKWRSSRVPFYTVAQLMGSILASFAVKVLFHPIRHLGTTTPSGTDLQALIMEIIVTFIMMFVISAVVTDSKAAKELAGIAVGSSVFIASILAGPVSGGSMNPARTIGPAIANNVYKSIWVYIVGPIIGALLGVMCYSFLRETNEPVVQSLPLNLTE